MLRVAVFGMACLVALTQIHAEETKAVEATESVVKKETEAQSPTAVSTESKTGAKKAPVSKTTTTKAVAAKKKKPAPGPNDWVLKHPTVTQLVALTNGHRARYGLHAVRINPQMCAAAQNHANWMANTGYFQHSGLPYMEIIFHGPRSPQDAINGWIASPAHHGIMISGATEVGFGYQNRNGQPYWVGVFR